MKKVLIISRKSKNEAIFISRIKKQNPDIDISIVTYPEIAIYAENDQSYVEIMDSHTDVSSFDLVFFKTVAKYPDMAAAICSYLDKRGTKYIDGAAKHSSISSKVYQYVYLANNGVHVPASIYINKGRIDECFGLFSEKLKLPFVLKDIHGFKGKHNFLISNEAEFRVAISEADVANVDLIAQGFIANDGDYRILVFGEEVYLVIYRQGTNGTHLNNLSSGGSFTQVGINELPEDVLASSLRAASVLDRQVAGVDMVQDKISGQWFCFEVNEGPQISSGVFTEEKAKAFGDFLKKA